MAWKLAGVDFKDYGVTVLRASGLLDMPRADDRSNDWLDEHGREFWQYASDVVYNDREIGLDCMMKADDYEDLLDKIDTFYGDLHTANLKTLTTPYGSIGNCSVQLQVAMARKTQYVVAWQVGLFTLRLTVEGVNKTKSFLVYKPDETIGDVIPVGYDGWKWVQKLMGDNYQVVSAELNYLPSITRGWYFNGPNSTGRFIMMGEPECRKLSTNKFSCSFRFDHEFFLLKNAQFMQDGKSEFYWAANMEDILDLVISNANRIYAGLFVKGDVDSTANRNHHFANEDCLTVLKRVTADYGLEFSYLVDDGEVVISVVEKIGTDTAYSFAYGHGNGLYSVTREQVNTEELCTVLYAYGSTRNLPTGYDRGMRLGLASAIEANVATYGKRELSKNWDDIFPEYTGTVTSYTVIATATETDVKQFILGMTLPFDLNDVLIPNVSAKLKFISGDLNGYEFEIHRYDHDLGKLWLKEFVDEHGNRFPGTFDPAANDQFKLYDIELPSEYVVDAEARLEAVAEAWLAENSVPKVPYRVESDPAATGVLQLELVFAPGNEIEIVDSDLGINKKFRISEAECKVLTWGYNLTLSDRRLLTPREVLQQRVEEITRAILATRLQEVDTKRKNTTTVGTLNNKLFDPVDDKLNVDIIVRNESIDPRMLAYDAGVPQFYITGLVVNTNANPNLPDYIEISAGTITITNYAAFAKSRYGVMLDRQAYDPTRTWIIDATNFSFNDSDGYFLYAKINLNEGITAGLLDVQKEHREVKYYIDEQDGRWLYYKLGFLNEPESPRQASMLWGNVKQNEIDPRLLLGGGNGVFLFADDSEITGYKKALPELPDGADAAYLATAKYGDGEVLIKAFATDPGFPGLPLIAAGAWGFETYARTNSPAQSSLVVRVYKFDGDEETELFSFSQRITLSATQVYYKAVAQNAITLAETDRLVVKYFFLTEDIEDSTMHLSVQGTNLSKFLFPKSGLPGENQLQADWDQEDEEAPDFIKNKPEIPGDWDEDIAFDFNDIEAGTAQTYVLDIEASFGYTILECVLQSDDTLDAVVLKIGITAVTGCNDMDVTTAITTFVATDGNTVETGDKVTLETSGTDGDPTLLRGKLRIRRNENTVPS